jgi:hypothetical protein
MTRNWLRIRGYYALNKTIVLEDANKQFEDTKGLEEGQTTQWRLSEANRLTFRGETTRYLTKVTRRVLLVGQVLLTLPKHLS